jgi:hypothetical protein
MEAPLLEPAKKKALGINLCNEAVFCDACTLTESISISGVTRNNGLNTRDSLINDHLPVAILGPQQTSMEDA